MVLGCLRRNPLGEHTEYLGRHTQTPLRPLTTPSREDGIFAALRRETPRQMHGRPGRTRRSQRTCVDSSRIKSSRAGTRHKAKPSCNAWSMRSTRDLKETGGGGWRKREDKYISYYERNPPPQGSLELNEGVVQGCGRTCAAT